MKGLSNSFFNFFIKIKNEKRTVCHFRFFYENEKRMKVLKIQRKDLSNMKIVVSYLNFVFFIEVKVKSKYRNLNFVSQFIKTNEMALWVHGFKSCSINLFSLQKKSIKFAISEDELNIII